MASASDRVVGERGLAACDMATPCQRCKKDMVTVKHGACRAATECKVLSRQWQVQVASGKLELKSQIIAAREEIQAL